MKVNKVIRPTESAERVIRDTSKGMPRVDPGLVAAALGAQPATDKFKQSLAPISLLAVRKELAHRLQSSGSCPAPTGAAHLAKIPLSDREWSQLESLAAAVAYQGVAPSAGQVASVLLTLTVQSISSQMSKAPLDSEFARQLAELAEAVEI